MKIKINKDKTHNIVCVEFEDQIDMTISFCRIQEFYEGPKYRNKVFAFEEFLDWYARNTGEGNFTYLQDWAGFNFPGECYLKFKKLFKDLSKKETEFFSKIDLFLSKYIDQSEKFYLIGSLETEKSVMEHEVTHAHYYLNEKYKKEVNKIINKYKKNIKVLYSKLEKLGYNKCVFKDEVNAYLTTGLEVLGYNKKLPIWLEKLKEKLDEAKKNLILA